MKFKVFCLFLTIFLGCRKIPNINRNIETIDLSDAYTHDTKMYLSAIAKNVKLNTPLH